MKTSDLTDFKDAIFADPNWDQFVPMSQELQKINFYDVENELSSHPARFCFFHGLMAEAKKIADQKESEEKSFIALKKQEIREQLRSAGSKVSQSRSFRL